MSPAEPANGPRFGRRRFLALGLGGAAVVGVAGATGFELVSHGVLPGRQALDQLDGACDVPAPATTRRAPGPSVSGTFRSAARNRSVGYTIAYPPGHGPGNLLPLVVMLHGFGGDHTSAVVGMTPAEALALVVDGRPLPAMAMVTVDGGGGYWTAHSGDDPMAMVVDELLPRCRARGLGRPAQGIGAMGISMGGYGALLLAERHPGLVSAVAAISPAVWTTYAEASSANAGAFASAAAFRADDVITGAPSLAGTPVRIAGGTEDPFHAGVVALVAALPPTSAVELRAGCHTDPFFLFEEGPSLAFLGAHLTH